jgi:hypothetical protein
MPTLHLSSSCEHHLRAPASQQHPHTVLLVKTYLWLNCYISAHQRPCTWQCSASLAITVSTPALLRNKLKHMFNSNISDAPFF